jgi:hypothetical protein
MICRRYRYLPNFTNCCVFITKPSTALHIHWYIIIFQSCIYLLPRLFFFALYSRIFFFLLVFDQTPTHSIFHHHHHHHPPYFLSSQFDLYALSILVSYLYRTCMFIIVAIVHIFIISFAITHFRSSKLYYCEGGLRLASNSKADDGCHRRLVRGSDACRFEKHKITEQIHDVIANYARCIQC